MELANCIVALGGDIQNTVPKFNVTPAEVALLLAIHGDQSVTEIEVTGTVERRNAEEAERLMANYPARNEDGALLLQVIYPGRSPVLHQTFADLQLPDDFFAVSARAVPAEQEPVKKARAKATAEAKPEPLNIKSANDATDLFDDGDDTNPMN